MKAFLPFAVAVLVAWAVIAAIVFWFGGVPVDAGLLVGTFAMAVGMMVLIWIRRALLLGEGGGVAGKGRKARTGRRKRGRNRSFKALSGDWEKRDASKD